MYLLCARYVIVLVIILTPGKFVSAKLNNVTQEYVGPEKVVTKLLNIPWINFNNSWISDVESNCKNDIMTLFESADAGEMWALQMLDAASKFPAGILKGNILDLGMYDECIEVKHQLNPARIQGRHCMVSLSVPQKFVEDASETLLVQKMSVYNPSNGFDFSLTLSLCFPSTCTVDDIAGFVNASIQSMPEYAKFEVGVARVICSSVESSDVLTMGSILTIFFLAVTASLLLLCTICDFVERTRPGDKSPAVETLAKFSLYTSALKLLSTETAPGTMPAIHGMRFLSTCIVIFVHRGLVVLLKPQVNIVHLFDVLGSSASVMTYTVDNFFLIGGFLTSYLFLKRRRAGVRFNILVFYLHRYIRLAPSVAVLLLVTIFIVPHLGSGPVWPVVIGRTIDYCRKNWWTNLLSVHNFVNRNEMCVPHTWYSAVEMQLYLISPIILYPLFHRPKLGLVILGLLSMASLVIPAVAIVLYQYSMLVNIRTNWADALEEFFNFYTITYYRALPYFVGIFLGYYTVNRKIRITKLQATLNWISTLICIGCCFWNNRNIMPSASVYSAIWEALYASIGRLAWSLAMAWTLYACIHGYGGPVTRFLSLPIFVPLSRLSYGIYLVSLVAQVGVSSVVRTAEFTSPFAATYLFWGDLALTIVAASILNLCFETPVLVLEEIIRARRPSSLVKHTSADKNEKPSPATGEYSDPIKSEVTEMIQTDFWQTMSDVLNTLSKRPAKTPAEWAKIWQEWQSDVMKTDSQHQIHANDVQNVSIPIKTEINTAESDFFTFLVAINCGLGDATSSVELSELT